MIRGFGLESKDVDSGFNSEFYYESMATFLSTYERH